MILEEIKNIILWLFEKNKKHTEKIEENKKRWGISIISLAVETTCNFVKL